MTAPDVRRHPLQARSRARYEEICDAALRLLRSGGLVACTMAAVATEAQLKPTSLYRYFPNIDALLHEIASRQLDEIHAWLSVHLSGLNDATEVETALAEAIEAYEAAYRYDPAMRALWAGSVALPLLVELNLQDSRRNAELIAATVNRYRDVPVPLERAFLYTHLVGCSVVLMLQLPDDTDLDIDAIRDELHRLMRHIVHG